MSPRQKGVSQGASLGDILPAPPASIEKVTQGEGLFYLLPRSETRKSWWLHYQIPTTTRCYWWRHFPRQPCCSDRGREAPIICLRSHAKETYGGATRETYGSATRDKVTPYKSVWSQSHFYCKRSDSPTGTPLWCKAVMSFSPNYLLVLISLCSDVEDNHPSSWAS